MVNYLNFFVTIVTNFVMVMILSLYIVAPAIAVTEELQFNSTTGYKAKTIFTYDENKNVASIEEQGKGKTQIVDYLKIDFYQPSGKLMATYNNIVDGVSTGNYFKFNFDPKTKKLTGNVDLGGELVGEVYLKGEVEQGLSLIEVTNLGEEIIIAQMSK